MVDRSRSRMVCVAVALMLSGCNCGNATGILPDGGEASSGSGTGGLASSGGGSGGTTGTGAGLCGLNAALCNGTCVVTLTDPSNCGGCGVVCPSAEVCASGQCSAPSACAPGFTACGQTCVDLTTSDDNCGACGHTCGTVLGCSTGLCVPTVGLTGQTPSCPNGGPPTTVQSGSSSLCTGSLAQTTFRWALCSCDEIHSYGQFTSDGFDSSTGPYVDGGLGGGVGANSDADFSGAYNVGGSLWTASTNGMTAIGGSSVGLEFHDNGNFSSYGMGSVGSNAFVNGNVQALGPLTVGGALYIPASASVGLLSFVSSQGEIQGPVTVTDPCDCAASQLIDVAGIVSYGEANNDDATIGLDPTVFATSIGGLRLDLPCGNYYLTEIQSYGTATIAVHGNAALFIGGDVNPAGGLQITIDPQATLDLFIGGNLTVIGASSFGSTLVPSQSRIYVAGTTVNFFGAVTTAGNFYAPAAQVAPSGSLTLYGSLFAGDYRNIGATAVHYDSAILNAGASCSDGGVPSSCSTCQDCGNGACVNGACGACITSADCCAPLDCIGGSCIQIQFK